MSTTQENRWILECNHNFSTSDERKIIRKIDHRYCYSWKGWTRFKENIGQGIQVSLQTVIQHLLSTNDSPDSDTTLNHQQLPSHIKIPEMTWTSDFPDSNTTPTMNKYLSDSNTLRQPPLSNFQGTSSYIAPTTNKWLPGQ